MANGGSEGESLRQVELFAVRKSDDLRRLWDHFDEQRGSDTPYPSIDALMADMLDDVIDVWLDDHLGSNASCEEVDNVDELWRSEVEWRARMEQGTDA